MLNPKLVSKEIYELHWFLQSFLKSGSKHKQGNSYLISIRYYHESGGADFPAPDEWGEPFLPQVCTSKHHLSDRKEKQDRKAFKLTPKLPIIRSNKSLLACSLAAQLWVYTDTHPWLLPLLTLTAPSAPRAARLPARRSGQNSLPCAAVDNTRR